MLATRGKLRSKLKEASQADVSCTDTDEDTVKSGTSGKRQKLEKPQANKSATATEESEAESETPKQPPSGRTSKAPTPTPKATKGGKQKKEIRASYVMKLFDRSVDLAKFSQNDPLYPICRDWMRNQPRAKLVKQEEEEKPPRRSVPEILTMVRNGIAAEIRFLPPPAIRDITKTPDLMEFQRECDKKNINLKYDLDHPPVSREALMRRNLSRWRVVRQHHQVHNRDFDNQYFESFEILDGIYRRVF